MKMETCILPQDRDLMELNASPVAVNSVHTNTLSTKSNVLKQQFPKFLPPGTSFMKDMDFHGVWEMISG